MAHNLAELSDPSHDSSLMISLRSFITNDSFVDIQFICQGGHKVFAHKLLLIPISKLLAKLLMEHPDSNEMVTIHLPDVNSKLLRIVINFLYIGSTRLNNNEMEQFKLVLKLLDIELFASLENENHYPPNSVTSRGSASVSNVPSMPVVSNVYIQRGTPTEQPVPRPSYAAGEVTTQKQQYIKIPTSQLTATGNPGEVLIPLSAVPVIYGGNNVVVGQVMPEESSYSTHMSNVVSSPTNNVNSNALIRPPLAAQPNVVTHIPASPMRGTSTSLGTTQTNLLQNIPGGSRASFSSENMQPTSLIIKPGVKRKLKRSNPSPMTSTEVIDLSDDDDPPPLTPMIVDVHSISERSKRGRGASRHGTDFSMRCTNGTREDSKVVIEIDQ